jgi:hypothetical protein
MKRIIVWTLIIVFCLASVGFAQPAWKQAGELPPGLQGKGGPPGMVRKAQIAQPATLTVVFDSGEVAVFDAHTFSSGLVNHFIVTGSGVIVDMVAEQNGRVTYWSGQGAEYADMSEYDEAQWLVVWTGGGAFGRGRQVLTIGHAEGFYYEVEEPIDEEPIDEEPIDEEPIDEPIDEEPIEEPEE